MAAWLVWLFGGMALVAWGPIQHMRNQGSADGGYEAGRAAASAAFGLPAIVWFVGMLTLLGWSVLAIGRDPLRSASLADRERRRRAKEPFPGLRAGVATLGAIMFVTMGAGMVGEEAVLAAAGRKAPARDLGPDRRSVLCHYEWHLAGETREIMGPCAERGATVDYLPAFPWVSRISGGSAWGKVTIGFVSLAIGVTGVWICVVEIRQLRASLRRGLEPADRPRAR